MTVELEAAEGIGFEYEETRLLRITQSASTIVEIWGKILQLS
jgi:hypothetical protein